MPNLIIGSRNDKLAQWQAQSIKATLESLHAELTVEIESINAAGDNLPDAATCARDFSKEIEDALLDRQIDLAVHHLADLPVALADGLHLAAITQREEVRDALVVSPQLTGRIKTLNELPAGARVSATSARRVAQLRHLRADLQLSVLSGSVATWLRDLDEGSADAIVLAAIELIHSGAVSRITEYIPTDVLLPAAGQGALGIVARLEDDRTNFLLEGLNHWPTRCATQSERALLRKLGGDAGLPVAAYGHLEGTGSDEEKSFVLEALIASIEGRETIYDMVIGSAFNSEELGEGLAERLLTAGAKKLFAAPATAAQTTNPPATIPPPAPKAPSRTEVSFVPLEDTPDELAVPFRKSKASKPLFDPAKAAVPAPASRSSTSSAQPSVPELSPASPPPAHKQSVANERVNPLVTHSAVPPLPPSQPVLVEPDNDESPFAHLVETPPALPLSGVRIIVTRAARQSGELTRLLQSQGASIILCPTIEIRDPSSWQSLDQAISRLSQYQWLAFTSTNGVAYFLRRYDELGYARPALEPLRICAVGKKTAERLLDEGLRVDLMPARFTADSLVEAFMRRYGGDEKLRGSKMLLPASRTTRDVIRPALNQLGVVVEVVEAYQTVLPERSAEIAEMMSGAPADYLIFTSPSTVANLATLLETDNLAQRLNGTRIACIGPVTTESAHLHGLQVHVQPEEHTAKGLVRALLEDRQRKQK